MSSTITSPIWYHFDRKEAGNGKVSGVCRYCKKCLALSGGSTGNLRRHLTTLHPTISVDRTHQSASGGRSTQEPAASTGTGRPTEQPATSSARASTTEESAVATVSASSSSVRPQSGPQPLISNFVEVRRPMPIQKSRALDIQLLKMVCKEFHPFSMVEGEQFQIFVQMLNPSYHLPSRKTLTTSLLPAVYNDLHSSVQQQLLDAPAVCLTCDGWTSINNTSFYALTAHFFDSNTKLQSVQSVLLECSEFSGRHTAENIASWITTVLTKYSINNKITALVTDNAANMKLTATILNVRHLGCFAHSLNLVVQSAVSTSMKDVVEKSKAIVQFFKHSSHALSKLYEMQRKLNMPKLKLKQDCPTRWNATYDLLDRLLRNKEAIVSTLALLESDLSLESHDWIVMDHAVKVLKVFYDVTVEISGEKTVSLSKIAVLSRLMTRHIRQYMEREKSIPENIGNLCDQLIAGLAKRFSGLESNELVAQSILLDPRFKKQGFGDDSKYNQAYQSLIRKLRMTGVEPPSVEPPQRANTESRSSVWGEFDELAGRLQASRDPAVAAIVEVDKYLAEPHLPRMNDPLFWWEERKSVYPRLYQMVLKRLCIPATSVPCERIFSKAGELCSDRRSRITSSNMEKIMYVNQNL